ncbi:MAG: L,D-transpeptidase family protein [Cyclobacteriaceae bacterium]|nr:L,D-transpeptidase family protein [Cyclobacteriaceae bacterium]
MKFLTFLFLIMSVQQTPFKKSQLQHTRVKSAYAEKETDVKKYFSDRNISFTGFYLFIRAFKKEKKLEVWVREKEKDTYALLHTYDFCSTSGSLGPKRKEGDLQIPEGVYHINHFNPVSNFYLSLGINYPNASDKILSDSKRPGSAIYIHGNCVTIGCIPITDDKIKELYVLAVEATNNGQQKIPVHIFPAKLNGAELSSLKKEFNATPSLIKFWENLEPIYQDFEKTKKLRSVKTTAQGTYSF